MRRLFLALPAVAVVALAGCASGGHSATSTSQGSNTAATTSPSAQSGATLDVNDTAGWNVRSASTIIAVTGSFTLSSASHSSHGSIGLQLCDSHTGYAVQFGAVSAPGGWTIGYFSGRLPSAAGIGGDPCAGNQFLKAGTITTIGTVRTGATMKAQIFQQYPGEFVFNYAVSNKANFSHRAKLISAKFDQAALSASYPGVDFRGALVNRIASFTGVTATSASGVTRGLAAWSPAQVSSSRTGKAPIVLSASALTPASGIAPSSFDILSATPKL